MPSDRGRSPNGALTVDGVTAGDRVVPADAQQIAAILAEAAAQGQTVVPVGGGTALALGNPPERADLALSTERLSQVIDYEPTDLVLSVGAGARFGDVQAVLGEHGQRLPLDPPGGEDATIGGLIATALSGPLRHSAGTLRDLLIGISVAHTNGTVSKAGGMVVKNVSGYDMPRLYHGSLGTLGVITSANFKVLPKPRAEATLIASFADDASAFVAASSLRAQRHPLAALEVSRQRGEWLLAARVEGRPQTVELISQQVAALLADARTLQGEESARWWQDYLAPQRLAAQGNEILLRGGVRSRETATLVAGLVAALESREIAMPYLAASPGLGLVTARLSLSDGGSPETLAAVHDVAQGLAETATILAAPSAWKRGLDVWGRTPDGFAVMKALREEYDPTRTLNPGRFAGFL
jgi:glycolate oxidase FAD binding subunit